MSPVRNSSTSGTTMEQGRIDDVIDQAATARATVDERGVITGWNEGARALLGYPPDEVVGRPAAELLAEDLGAVFGRRRPDGQPLEDHDADGGGAGRADGGDAGPRRRFDPLLGRWSGSVRLRHRNGGTVTAQILGHHRRPAHGPADWLLVSALHPEPVPGPGTDEFSLGDEGFAQSPCAMALYDAGLRLRRANTYMERAVGLREDDARGLRLPEILMHPGVEQIEQRMREVLGSGRTEDLQQYVHLIGRDQRAWSVILAPLRGRSGEVRGVCLSAHDVTEQHQARQRLLLLNEASTRIGSTLDVRRTAQELADVAVPKLADLVTVDLLASPDSGPEPPLGQSVGGKVTLRREAQRSIMEGIPESVVEVGAEASYPPSSPPAQALATGRTTRHRVSDPELDTWMADDPTRLERLREFGHASFMVVPMRARGITLGLVIFYRHQRSEPFEQDDQLLAEEIAARAAICIDNARRYTRERGTAVTLQRSLLPQELPEQAAVDVSFRYLPAGALAGVGGDWFDVIPLSGARVALVVGDVVGHGIHASATMGRLRTAVRTLADVDLPPDELLTHLDDLVLRLATHGRPEGRAGTGAPPGPSRTGGMVGERGEERPETEDRTPGEIGATCLYAVYDPVSRRCTLARAGHPEPALVRPAGRPGASDTADGDGEATVELIELPAGPPLGLGGVPFEAAEVEVPEGSLLALYTDGLIQARDRNMEAGQQRLLEALGQPAASLETVCDTVLGALLPGRPADDIALLVARTRALDRSQVATWDVPADPAVVAQARKNASDQLVEWGLESAIFVTELIVSELVTNAIRHAEAPIQFRLIHDRSLICEVSDSSSTAPHLRRARSFDEGGRGLLLVAQLTQRWGTRQTSGGKVIWAEQALPPAL
ncbi:SpoIIE family protein phosphatase [Streptomyces sp. B6B3]|uniref:SpoIIE family protein phosphatase n=1 Tax=Streptomyces sp. B6B3 TaxID=3153570 RepID=UPI00325CC277